MTLRFVDSWDHYNSSQLPYKYNSAGAIAAITAAAGRNGTNGLRFAGGTNDSHIALAMKLAGETTQIFGHAFILRSAPTLDLSVPIAWMFEADNTLHVTIAVNQQRFLAAYRGYGDGFGGSTLLGVSSVALQEDVSYYLEYKVTISDTVGVVEIRLNGVVIMNLINQDTKNGGTAGTIDSVTFGAKNRP